MLPILLLGGAAFAALFVSGCSQDKKPHDAGTGDTLPAGAPPSASGSAYSSAPASQATPSPPRGYLASFGTDLRAAELYQRLHEAKVSDETLDRGCNFPILLNVPVLRREKDHRIDACEVYDFVLENYQKYPEIVETLTGRPIPWSLDDRDSATQEDEKIRERIKAVIAKLQESPGLKKYGWKSDEYKRGLSQALTLFVDFPNDPQYLKDHQEELRKQSEVLVDLDLKDFQEELLNNGGFGVTQFSETGGEIRVNSALQALAEHRGDAAARAKVLYGVLALANLDPTFAFLSQKSNSDLVEDVDAKHFQSRLNYGGKKLRYLQVAVQLAKKNPATGRPEIFSPQGLREADRGGALPQEMGLTVFLAEDFHEQGNYWLTKSKQGDQAVLSYKLALNMYPTNSGIYNSIGVLMDTLGNKRQAETAYQESLRFDLTNGFAAYNLGTLYQDQGKLDKAIEQFLTTVVFSPQVFERHQENIGQVVQTILKTDANHQTAKALDSKLKQLREKNGAEK